MCVHTFGAVSSPSCANFTLKKAADDTRERYGEDARNTVYRDFYVDDLLKSSNTNGEAVSLLTRVQSMCEEGGFNLTKIISTSPTVINSVQVENRALPSKQFHIVENTHIERSLGVAWYVADDKLGFNISLRDTPLTRRGILSTISSVFDPLGLASPFLLKGRFYRRSQLTEKVGR